MNFASAQFVLLFPLVLLIWRLTAPRWRWAPLLAASWLFYAGGQPQAFPLLLLATGVCYLAALRVAQSRRKAARRAWLALALGTCLGILFLFKYLGFAASLFGLSAPALPLPVGISFYTFQNLSYVIDAYRGTMRPERHFGYYALFVAYFPQLVAGPIERPQNLLPQLHAAADPTAEDCWAGAQFLLRGYCKKLVVADFAARFVDPVYAAPDAAAGPAVVLATVLFALQIYGDFSGYSDIACGAARLMGVRLMKNFDAPYTAASIREFWRRWHISLTSWLTDYLYIPLGGSRCGKLRRCANIMAVFLASGLWHGANWTFVVWGALHGAAQVFETLLPARAKLPRRLGQGLTFAFVCFAWVFFRADTVGDALRLLAALPAGWTALPGLGLTPADLLQVALGTALLLRLKDWPAPLPAGGAAQRRGLAAGFFLTAAAALAWLSLLAAGAGNAFIYFQF